jgi:heme A synthase
MSHTDAAARHQAGRSQAGKLARLRMASLGAVAMLVIEFILGVIYNLYGTAPTAKKSIGLFSSPDLALHVILGILLFAAAVVLLIRAIGARHALSIWLSAVGLVAIIGAGFAGLGFTSSGAAGASLGMSLAFAAALGCYIAMLVVLAPASAAPADPPSASPTP